MPSTFSNLGLELQATGENANTWGQKTNVGLQRVDNAIAGYTTVQANSTTITLAFSTNSGSTTFTDENGRNKILKFTSGTAAAAITVTVPDIEKEYLVRNETGQNVTFSAGGSTTVTIATGKNAHIYIDGASAVYNGLADIVTTSLDTGAITTTGITSTGNINLGDSDQINLGASNDLQLYHDGSNSQIIDSGTGDLYIKGANNIYFQDNTSGDVFARFNNNSNEGNVKLYYNNLEKLATTSTGVDVTGTVTADGLTLGDNEKAQFGASNDLQIYHDGGNSIIKDNGTGFLSIQSNGSLIGLSSTTGENYALFRNNGAAELYYDNNKKFETTSSGIAITGTVNADQLSLGDNEKAYFGTGSDLQIYHDGTHSYIEDVGTGHLRLRANDRVLISQYSNNEAMAIFNVDGSVDLRYDNSTKLETTSTGIDVTGEVLADKAYIAEATLTDGATINWDMSTQSVAKVTLGGNRTLAAPTNGSTGQFCSLNVIQDGTGSRTLTWNAAFEFKDDTAPTLTTTGGKGDLFVFRYNGSKWLEVGRNLNISQS